MRINKINNDKKQLGYKKIIFSIFNKNKFLNIKIVNIKFFKKIFGKIRLKITILTVLQLLNYKYKSQLYLRKLN
tara:strand:+ start:353 stop:574 length:222 start_codon:yes stop_codon:yes gene_type:complete